MPRKQKYYGTNANIYGNQREKLKQHQTREVYHNQYRIVCKASSRAEANRIAESYRLGKKVFHPDYTSETGNNLELELCDKYGFIINADGTIGDNYIDIKLIL